MRLIDADTLRAVRSIQRADFNSIETVQQWIDDAPTIEAEPVRRGRWEKLYQGNYKCSECGDWWAADDEEEIKTFRYCPNCGAKMENDNE